MTPPSPRIWIPLSPRGGPTPAALGALLLRLVLPQLPRGRGPPARGAVAEPASSAPRLREMAPRAVPPPRPRSPANRMGGPPHRHHPRHPLPRSTPPLLWPPAASSGASRAPPSSWPYRSSFASDRPSSASPSRCGPGSSVRATSSGSRGLKSRTTQRIPCKPLSAGSGDGKEVQKTRRRGDGGLLPSR